MSNIQVEFADFSGVDSRSSPLRLPPGRALRSRNWVVKPNGILQLRYGYTRPAMSATDTSSPIHSAGYYELNSGVRHVLFGQGTALKKYEVGSTGTVTTISTLSTNSAWNGVYENNHFLFGNGTDKKDFDGTNLRDIGIRSPTAAEAASVSVAYSTASGGSWSTTGFSGHQLYMSYYNPQNGHVGNRIAIGARFTIGTASGVVVVTGLPDLSGVNAEFVKLIGRTHDNGEVPFVFVDTSGTYIVVGNTASTATFTLPNVDVNSEMPTRNGLPPRFNKIAWAIGRAYAIDEDDPTAIRYSESQADVPSGLFVGLPPHAWPSSNKVFFPTGERALAIHGVDDEIWVWTRNHLAILTEFGTAESSIGRPVVRWRGTWVGGIAGHRAFTKTRYGPFWTSSDKQLMTRGQAGPQPASEEYEGTLLVPIADAQLPNVELAYLFDSSKDLDALYIHGKDAGGNQVEAIHDFGAGNIGSEHIYPNLLISTFVRNPQQVVSMRDSNGKMRLWIGDTAGKFAQLEDGDSDSGSTYSADYIGVLNLGPSEPTLGALEWFGDSSVRITVSPDLRLTLADLDSLTSLPATLIDDKVSLNRVQVEDKGQYMYLRVQLDSHHADGTLLPSSPVAGVPLETYGRVYLSRPDVGMPRKVGRSNP